MKKCKIKKKSTKEKVKELIVTIEKDRRFLLDTKTKLIKELNKIEVQLLKNEGATLILKKILEGK